MNMHLHRSVLVLIAGWQVSTNLVALNNRHLCLISMGWRPAPFWTGSSARLTGWNQIVDHSCKLLCGSGPLSSSLVVSRIQFFMVWRLSPHFLLSVGWRIFQFLVAALRPWPHGPLTVWQPACSEPGGEFLSCQLWGSVSLGGTQSREPGSHQAHRANHTPWEGITWGVTPGGGNRGVPGILPTTAWVGLMVKVPVW